VQLVKKSFTFRGTYYRVHKTPLLDPVLNQKNPVHIFTYSFITIYINIVNSCMCRSPKWLLPIRFSYKLFYTVKYK